MSIEFIPAVCPKCGGELRVPSNLDVCKCMYCGIEIILNRTNDSNTKALIENLLKLAREAEKVGNYQEAYNYFSLILEKDSENRYGWLGKAFSTGRLSTLNNYRIIEAISYFDKGFLIDNEINKSNSTEPSKNYTNPIDGTRYCEYRSISFFSHISLARSYDQWGIDICKQAKTLKGRGIEYTYNGVPLFVSEEEFNYKDELNQLNKDIRDDTIKLYVRAFGHFGNNDIIENWTKNALIVEMSSAIQHYLEIAYSNYGWGYDKTIVRNELIKKVNLRVSPYVELINNPYFLQKVDEVIKN